MSDQVTETNEALEQEARELGWMPKEEFKGSPERWIPADQFVERGRHILPIVQENKERLQGELRQATAKISEMAGLLKASQESIAALEEHHQADLKRRLELARKELIEQLKEAKREGDVEQEVELTAQLTELNKEPAAPAKPAAEPAKPALKPEDQQVFDQWQSENKWFGADKRRTALAMAISNQLRADGNRDVGRKFLEAVAKEVDEVLGPVQGAAKVESSRGGARGASSAGKGYHDLPQEAKQACDGFIDRLVGPGRAYKTPDEWRAKYAKDYFAE